MQAFEPLMEAGADKLLGWLDAAAQEGSLVNVHTILQRMSMEIISRCAFGLRLVAFARACCTQAEQGLRHCPAVHCPEILSVCAALTQMPDLTMQPAPRKLHLRPRR